MIENNTACGDVTIKLWDVRSVIFGLLARNVML